LREREILIDNQEARVHLIIEMSRPALRHGSLDSLFQVALYLPFDSEPPPQIVQALAPLKIDIPRATSRARYEESVEDASMKEASCPPNSLPCIEVPCS
jgi:hypothetical protein